MNSGTVFTGTAALITIVFVTYATSAIGVKSSTGLNGIDVNSAPFIACVLIDPTSSV